MKKENYVHVEINLPLVLDTDKAFCFGVGKEEIWIPRSVILSACVEDKGDFDIHRSFLSLIMLENIIESLEIPKWLAQSKDLTIIEQGDSVD